MEHLPWATPTLRPRPSPRRPLFFPVCLTAGRRLPAHGPPNCRALRHHVLACLPVSCGVCGPSPPLSLCCERVVRAQVRLCSSFTLKCRVPTFSIVSSTLSPSLKEFSPRWLVP